MRLIAVFFIRVYQIFISPSIIRTCRFNPTCSNYAIRAVEIYGIFIGFTLIFKRLIKCHPIKFLGGKAGFDPVPEIKKKNN